MVLKEFDITLDLIKSKQLSPIEVVQGDFETNIFNIQITKDYAPVDLTGTTIEVMFAKPDNTTVMQDMTSGVSITDVTQGKIQIVLNTNTIAASGMAYAEVRIKEAGKIVTTAKFNFYVRKAIVSNVVSTNEFPILEQLIEDVEQLKTDIVNLQVPDGSLMDVKLSNEAGQIKERVSTIQQKVDDLEEEMNAPDYSAPQEVTASVITLPDDVVEGQFSEFILKAQTIFQFVKNGNFADGTTGWSGGGATLSAANNILTITGNGGSISPRAEQVSNIDFVSGKKIYFRAKLKVTNDVCASIAIAAYGSTTVGTVQSISQTSPANGTVYVLDGIVTLPSNGAGKVKFQVQHGYVDTTTANGKVMEVQEVMAIDLDQHPELASMTTDEINQAIPHWLQYGVNSTESVRAKAEGKNYLKDYDKNVSVNAYSLPGNLFDVPYVVPQYTDMTFKAYNCNIPNNTSIAIKSEDKSATLATISVGTGDKVITFNTGNNKIIWLRFYCGVNSPITYQYAQLENGTTATEWEEYKNGGEAYIDKVGGSLPNGVFDEINVISGKGTERTSKKVLQVSDITSLYTGLSNVDTVNINPDIYTDIKDKGVTDPYGTKILTSRTRPKNSTSIDDASLVWTHAYNGTNIYLVVPKGYYANLAAAQADLAGTTLIYQLATPITHKGTPQSLIAYPKGHLIIECVKRVTKPYDNGITVDKPIESIESVTKIEDGERIPIDLSKITVASNKLSLTITGAAKNEVYEIIYHYNGVLPTVRFSYTQNVAAAIDGNTKGVAANSKAISDFIAYQNAVNLQFDLRITALEP